MLGEISGDTTINLSLLITMISVFGTAVVTAAVTLITQGMAITHIREDVKLQAEQDRTQADRLKSLEDWRIRQDTLGEANASTTRGTHHR